MSAYWDMFLLRALTLVLGVLCLVLGEIFGFGDFVATMVLSLMLSYSYYMITNSIEVLAQDVDCLVNNDYIYTRKNLNILRQLRSMVWGISQHSNKAKSRAGCSTRRLPMEEIGARCNVKSGLGAVSENNPGLGVVSENNPKWSKKAAGTSDEKLVDRVLAEGFDKYIARGKNGVCGKPQVYLHPNHESKRAGKENVSPIDNNSEGYVAMDSNLNRQGSSDRKDDMKPKTEVKNVVVDAKCEGAKTSTEAGSMIYVSDYLKVSATDDIAASKLEAQFLHKKLCLNCYKVMLSNNTIRCNLCYECRPTAGKDKLFYRYLTKFNCIEFWCTCVECLSGDVTACSYDYCALCTVPQYCKK